MITKSGTTSEFRLGGKISAKPRSFDDEALGHRPRSLTGFCRSPAICAGLIADRQTGVAKRATAD